MAKLISVFVAGVQKAGTTSLYAYLREHPDLSPPKSKELHFFDDESRDWSRLDPAKLEVFFEPADGDRLRFEATPIYTYWPPVIARIFRYNPAAKLIILFRDPFERAWSQWCMEYDRRNEKLLFALAIRMEAQRLSKLAPLAPARRVHSYLDRGRYGVQVRRLFEFFPRDQVYFLRSEDLSERPGQTLAGIAEFLGIAPFASSTMKRENVRPSSLAHLRPTEADLKFFVAHLQKDMADFAMLSGLDIAGWPSADACERK